MKAASVCLFAAFFCALLALLAILMGEREQLYEHCSGVRHTESAEVTHSQVSGVEKCGCASVRLSVRPGERGESSK